MANSFTADKSLLIKKIREFSQHRCYIYLEELLKLYIKRVENGFTVQTSIEDIYREQGKAILLKEILRDLNSKGD